MGDLFFRMWLYHNKGVYDINRISKILLESYYKEYLALIN